ncbi:MAG: hypothetical protein JOY80_10025 [Candidatus Dormibacteraeota bacterium]|nr:hypothetical protein [Candidatus Dormibacteraeota bacterium]
MTVEPLLEEDEEAAAATRGGEVRELEEHTDLGEIYLSALIRRHLRLSLITVAVFVVALCLQPLVATLWPVYGDLRLAGIPVSWIVLGIGSYPLMYLLAVNYTRRAEAIDDEFTHLFR